MNIFLYYFFFFIIIYYIFLYLRIIYTLLDVILDILWIVNMYVYVHKIELVLAQFKLVVSMKCGHVYYINII